MNETAYLSLLKQELTVAYGCTEPASIAYTVAEMTNVLGGFPHELMIICSGNIIKNVKSVLVPNSGGKFGVRVAAILGALANQPMKKLEILSAITDAHEEKLSALLAAGYCTCELQPQGDTLYIKAVGRKDGHEACAIVEHTHTGLVFLSLDGEILLNTQNDEIAPKPCVAPEMSVKNIVEFAQNVDLANVASILDTQITLNTAISKEGMLHAYGAQVGQSLLSAYGDTLPVRAKALTAAASDARMGGSTLPVVVNSGSGNQGITVTVAVVEYAKHLGCSQASLYRSLLISNLISIHIKSKIGKLSAFCGAVSAACGAGAGITYLKGGTLEQIENTIETTLGNTCGIVCDGAKASCAMKIAASLDAALLAHTMAMDNLSLSCGDGIIGTNVEQTIENVGTIGRLGMQQTDTLILEIMMQSC